MYRVSAEFLAALRAPHQMTARIELWAGDTRLTGALAFSDGAVTLDRTNQVFGTCEVTAQLTRTQGLVVQDGTIDLGAVDVYGLTLRPYRGIRLGGGPAGGGGRVEEVPLGRFLIERTDHDVTDTAVTLQASGFRSLLRDDRFLSPYTPPLDTPQRDVLRKLITDSRPRDPINTTEWNALRTTPAARGTTWETDRLTAVDELATALGVQVYPDRHGIWRFDPLADTARTAPAWRIDAGPTGVLTKASLVRDRAAIYNAVVASGETTTSTVPPVRAVAYHTDPSSPTRWGGPFGRRPYFYASPQLHTTADCQKAAATILRRLTLADTVIDLEAAPNPALDPDDAITVVLPDGTRLVYLLDAVTIPLTPDGPLTVTTRQRPEPADQQKGPAG